MAPANEAQGQLQARFFQDSIRVSEKLPSMKDTLKCCSRFVRVGILRLRVGSESENVLDPMYKLKFSGWNDFRVFFSNLFSNILSDGAPRYIRGLLSMAIA